MKESFVLFILPLFKLLRTKFSPKLLHYLTQQKYMYMVTFREGCPIQPGSCLQKIMYLIPTLESNRGRRGIALDAQLKHQTDTTIASSTL